MPNVLTISALTIATHDMPRSVRFYTALGFGINYGGTNAAFTSFSVGAQYLNVIAEPDNRRWSWWGRVIFHVDDVDAFYANAVARGLEPEAPPRDAEWGERYFHIVDPDGHELSFAVPLRRPA